MGARSINATLNSPADTDGQKRNSEACAAICMHNPNMAIYWVLEDPEKRA